MCTSISSHFLCKQGRNDVPGHKGKIDWHGPRWWQDCLLHHFNFCFVLFKVSLSLLLLLSRSPATQLHALQILLLTGLSGRRLPLFGGPAFLDSQKQVF